MNIVYSRTAVKAIEAMDKDVKQRIKAGIEGLTEVPPLGDIKMMQGINPPGYRLRVGKYRVLYQYHQVGDKQALLIKDVGSRGDIYK